MTQPRQIYASAADRRSGRRWGSSRRRPAWVHATALAAAAAVAALAGELLRGLT
jgi:hypothetical protein